MSNNFHNTDKSGKPNISNDIPEPVLSANTFFHYVDKIKYIYEILDTQQISPRFTKEDYSMFNIGFDNLYIAEKCFCDILLHQVNKHKKEYGNYCIGFSKEWGLSNGLQPVIYFNNQNNEFLSMIERNFKIIDGLNDKDADIMGDILGYNMKYYKPVYGRDLKTNKNKIFMDEREWRYVPNIDSDFSEILTDDDIAFNDAEIRETYNKLISKSYALSFDYSDIKYLIVNTKSQIQSMVKHIDRLNVSNDVKNLLKTRIFSWEEIERDL